MQNLDSLNETQQLLLVAAVLYKMGPHIEIRANCAKIVGQVIAWNGLFDQEVSSAWDEDEVHPVIDRVYDELIRMIGHLPKEEALFKGAGNFGTADTPASRPHFTGCRLTPLGQEIGEEFARRRPECKLSFE